MRLRPRHLRTRLTLWYVSVLAGSADLRVGHAPARCCFGNCAASSTISPSRKSKPWKACSTSPPTASFTCARIITTIPNRRRSSSAIVEVLAPDGAVLFRNERLGNRPLGGTPFSGEGVGGYSARSARLVGWNPRAAGQPGARARRTPVADPAGAQRGNAVYPPARAAGWLRWWSCP